ncbi:MAG TPA: O-methyltransferase [Herpetosiphonaceae bacterium]
MKIAADAILRPEQAAYLDSLLPSRDAVAGDLEADAAQHDVPIVDPEIGRFLEMTAIAIGARRILEVGTATGYSGLHLARGLADGGELVTIDVDPARQETARQHFAQAGVAERVTLLLGPALEQLPNVTGSFDLVFLDAVKTEYRQYLDLALPLLRTGGVVIADNVLSGGRIAHADEHNETLDAIRDFNTYAMSHPQLLSVILPFGDGLLYAVKRDPS